MPNRKAKRDNYKLFALVLITINHNIPKRYFNQLIRPVYYGFRLFGYQAQDFQKNISQVCLLPRPFLLLLAKGRA